MDIARHRLGLAGRLLGLLCLLLVVQGCPPTAPPASVRFPITYGSHTALPPAQQRILLWGEPRLTDVAVEWLRSHHYASILVPEKHSFPATHVSEGVSDRKTALVAAENRKAEVVLLLELEESQEGALLEPHCGSLFHVGVEVRGLSVESGDTLLRGHAHYPHCVALSDTTIRSLTCQALATAWGYRPSGQLDLPSDLMCTTGQIEPIPFR